MLHEDKSKSDQDSDTTRGKDEALALKRAHLLKKNLQLSIVVTSLIFIFVMIRTNDIGTSLLVSFAIFLSSLMWVVIYWRSPNR